MIEAARLSAVIEADTEKATRDIEAFSTKFGGLARTIDTVGNQAMAGFGRLQDVVGTGLKVAAGAGVGAIAGIGAAIGKMVTDAAPVEGVRNAFQGLAQDSDATLAALQRGSLGMIKNADLMQTFNKAAQLVSVDFAEKLPNAMEYLSKVSAATGQDMGFLLDSLVTGVGRLSPMILDNLAIQVDVTAANEEYAQSIGKSTDELTKQEQQTALMNQVLAKLQANTAKMPDIAGNATTSWAKMRAAFANTADAIGLQLLPMVEGLLAGLSPFVTQALDLAQAVIPQVIGRLEGLSQAFQTGAAGGDLLGGVVNALRSLGDVAPVFDTLGDALTRVGDTIDAVIAPIAAAMGQFVSWKDILIVLGAVAASVIVPALAGIIVAAAPVVAVFAGLVAAVALVRTAWETDFGGIREITASGLAAVQGALQSGLAVITGFWAAHGAQVTAFVQTLWTTLQAGAVTAIAALQTGIRGGLVALQGFWTAHGAAILAAVGTMWAGIQSAFQTAVAIVQSVLAAFTSAAEGNWYAFGAHLREAWDTAWAAISGAIAIVGPQIVAAVGALVEDAKRRFTSVDWGSVGSAIIDGIAAGVDAAAHALIDAAVAAARAAIDAVKGALGIQSPSKVAADAIGRPFVEGIAAGITQHTGSLVSAAAQALNATVDTVAAGAARLAQGILGSRIDPGEVAEAFGAARTFLEVGSAAGSLMNARIIDPLKGRIAAIDAERRRLQSSLNGAGGALLPAEQLRVAARLAALDKERADANEKIKTAQADVTRLQAQQQNLSFLESQVKLLDLIRERHLDPKAILGDLQLGVGANVQEVTEAMTRAVAAIIGSVESGLGITPVVPLPPPLPVGATTAPHGPTMTAGAVTNQYNLTIHSNAPVENIIQDFRTLQTFART